MSLFTKIETEGKLKTQEHAIHENSSSAEQYVTCNKTKAIQKSKDYEMSLCSYKRVTLGGFNPNKKLLFYSKIKCNQVLTPKTNQTNTNDNSEFQIRSYLKNTKFETTRAQISAQSMALQKRISPIIPVSLESKMSFQNLLDIKDFTSSQSMVIDQSFSFCKSNDISASQHNPVIQKIQNHLAKTGRMVTQRNRPSFLQITNIWTQPSIGQQLFERQNEQSQDQAMDSSIQRTQENERRQTTLEDISGHEGQTTANNDHLDPIFQREVQQANTFQQYHEYCDEAQEESQQYLQDINHPSEAQEESKRQTYIETAFGNSADSNSPIKTNNDRSQF